MRLCAVICARNEARYLPTCLSQLEKAGVDAIVIDHGSEDQTQLILHDHKHRPVIDVVKMPYEGVFSLSEQMAVKQAVYDTLDHDWLIHMDADEILESRNFGESLKGMIARAERIDATVINFDEFVFLPNLEEDLSGADYYRKCLRYYLHDPRPHRLQRIWKNGLGLTSAGRAGHVVEGSEHRLFSENQNLRHYIVLSNSHAAQKYVGRPYDPKETQKGMHRNRLKLTSDQVKLPRYSGYIRKLVTPDSTLDRSAPSPTHYWSW